MEKLHAFVVTLVFLAILFKGGLVTCMRNEDGSEEWGYVQVRSEAHLFWWLYRSPYRAENPSKPWPTILWLQGGTSGVGFGNFGEIGPLDINLKTRNFTWLRKADLLFVDSPVGTGYSYAEDTNLYAKTEEEATADLVTLLTELSKNDANLQKSPLFIVAESYGGKFAVTLALSALKAIQQGKLKLILGGVALGNSWISPEDFVGPLLKDLSRLDDNGLKKANSIAERIKQQLQDGQFVDATNSWGELQSEIIASSNSVDFHNFLQDSESDSVFLNAIALGLFKEVAMMRYSKYLTLKTSSLASENDDIERLLDGVIKNKLKIIPQNVTYTVHSTDVFENFMADFMKPRVSDVDELLALGVNVTVYNGQVDLFSATKGTESWLKKLKWPGLQNFLGKDRTPIYCGSDKTTRGFFKSHKNLQFYWILGAGHFVPIDQPCVALDIVGAITQSPAA